MNQFWQCVITISWLMRRTIASCSIYLAKLHLFSQHVANFPHFLKFLWKLCSVWDAGRAQRSNILYNQGNFATKIFCRRKQNRKDKRTPVELLFHVNWIWKLASMHLDGLALSSCLLCAILMNFYALVIIFWFSSSLLHTLWDWCISKNSVN